MNKNILIIGPARSGKTTLSRMINKEFGYSIINLDDIVCSFESSFPELGIKHDYSDTKVSNRLAPFLIRYFKELSEGPNFYSDNKFVIEGVYIDFEKIMPTIDKDKYLIIGLTYNNINSEQLLNNIKQYDTEDDWTYYCNLDELKGNVDYFIESNKYFKEMFNKYNIKSYDVSLNREDLLKQIIEDIKKS